MGASISTNYVHPDMAQWTHIETITYSASATETSTALSGYDEYLVIIELIASAANWVQMRVNGDSSAIYDIKKLTAVAVASNANQTQWQLTRGTTTQPSYGIVTITGTAPTVASGELAMRANLSGLTTSDNTVLGHVAVGSAVTLSSITILASAGTLTGTVKIYGRTW